MAKTFPSCAVSGWLGACGGGVGPEGAHALIEQGPSEGGGGRDIKASAPLLGGVKPVQRKRE